MNKTLNIFSTSNKYFLLDNTFTKEKLISYINSFDSEHYLNECTFTHDTSISFQYGSIHHRALIDKVKDVPIITIRNFKPTKIHLKGSFTQVSNYTCYFGIGIEVPGTNQVYRILGFIDPNYNIKDNDGGLVINNWTTFFQYIKTNNNIDYTWNYNDDTGLQTFLQNVNTCNLFIESSLYNVNSTGNPTWNSNPFKIEKLEIIGE